MNETLSTTEILVEGTGGVEVGIDRVETSVEESARAETVVERESAVLGSKWLQ